MDKSIANIEAMLPHQKPMRMVSEIVAHNDDSLTATAIIDDDNPLLEQGAFPGHAALELLAQASGLFLGLRFAGETRPGAIVSIRNMQVHTPQLNVGKALTIETRFLGGSETAAMFQGRVISDETVAMEAMLTVSSFPEGVMQ